MASILDSIYFDFFYFVTLIASVACGYLLAHYYYFRGQRTWKVSGIENAVVGFYGLLLSFTLVQSSVSNKERIDLVHKESDAIPRFIAKISFFPIQPGSLFERRSFKFLN